MDCRSLGLVFFDQEDRHGGQQHEDPGERQHVGRVGGEAVLDDGTAGQSDDDLGDGDREIEDTHVYAHAAWLDCARQDGVGHGEDARPGDADPHHREHQRVLVVQQAQPR